jgi:hypothetical protein
MRDEYYGHVNFVYRIFVVLGVSKATGRNIGNHLSIAVEVVKHSVLGVGHRRRRNFDVAGVALS